MSRFENIKYDDDSIKYQQAFKELFETLGDNVDEIFSEGRTKSLVFTKLEEAYMWIGKAIRDEQLSRNDDNETSEDWTNI